MMRTIFVVETPLQMLNAIEAKHALDLGECWLVVILSDPFPEKVFLPLLAFADWKGVEYLHVTHRFNPVNLDWLGRSVSERLNEYVKESRQLIKHLRFDRLAARWGDVDNVVLGNLFAGYMQHLANRVRSDRVYLVDDGTDTLRVNTLRQRNPAAVPAPAHVSPLRRAKDRFRRAFLDWDTSPVDSVTFFTSYNLETRPEDRSIKNDYGFWRSRLENAPRRDAVYFLGQPLVEDGYLGPDTYLDALADVVAFYAGENFVYLTHRRESQANVEAIKARGISVGSFELPIELQMLTDGIPKELASFFSTALDNGRIIFGSAMPVTAFRIPRGKFIPGHEFVDDIYDYFNASSGTHFRVLAL